MPSPFLPNTLPNNNPAPLGAMAPRGFTVSKPVRMPTLMLVEDSRYACEVMRLYARALGLRLRRAADLETAASHLRLYRPDIVLVDLGLPDGRGEVLIAQLAASTPRPPLILATSGQGDLRRDALAAGADAFIEKPMPDLASFRALLVDYFPGPLPLLLLPARPAQPIPDKAALKDDLGLAAKTLSDLAGDFGASPSGSAHLSARTRYVAGLLDGVAGSLGDGALQNAARRQLQVVQMNGGQMNGGQMKIGQINMAQSAQNALPNGQVHDTAPHGESAETGTESAFRHLRDLVNERLRDVMADRSL